MPTSPPTISAAPPAPARTSPTTFAALADAFVAWLEAEAPDIGLAASVTYDNAVEAAASSTAAQSAATSVGAALWVSGTTYSIGDVRRSPTNYFPYRRITAGAGTTDPVADATNWALGAAAANVLVVVTGTTQALQAWGHYVLTNASATTATLPASPAAGDLILVTIANSRIDNVIARNGKNIMSLAEDLTVDMKTATVELRYVDTTRGWVLA